MALILTEQEEALWMEGSWDAAHVRDDCRERVWRHRMEGIIPVTFIDGTVAFRVDSQSGEIF
jgi:hypothetical protein